MHRIEVPSWAIERGSLMNRFPALDAGKTALIVVDMQHGFIAPEAPFPNIHAQDIIPNVNRIVDAMRAAGALICWSRQTFVEDGPGRTPDWQLFEGSLPSLSRASLAEGSPEREIYAGLNVAPGDLVFDKYRYSCFLNAAIDLDRTLREAGIETVVIVGTITNCCCETTARDAAMRDYRVYFISDATAALTDEEHNAALLSVATIVGQVVTTGEMIDVVAAGAKQDALVE